jgi:CheY-like chemotaxis protein
VLIVEDSPDVASVVQEVLADEGYDAATAVAPRDVVAEVREQEPDALALGLPPDVDLAGDLLDALRVDPVARRVPVLATSSADAIADAARASYTVQETIRQPFDLDDLLRKVERTLARPPLQASVPDAAPEGVLAQAEPIVAVESRAVLLRWVARLRAEQPWVERADASAADGLDGAAGLVDALDASLRMADPAALLDEHPEAAERVRTLAAERGERGILLPTYVRELTLLRDELWEMLARELPCDLAGGDRAALERAVNGSLDRIVEVAVPALAESAPDGAR